MTAVMSQRRPRRAFVADLPRCIGHAVTLNGWVSGVRRAGSLVFLSLRDRTGTVQIVDKEGIVDALPEALTVETGLQVSGDVREGTVVRYGATEVELEELIVLAPAVAARGNQTQPEPRRSFLELRRPERFLVFKVQTTLEAALREFLLARGFIELHTPKITPGGSESGAAVFELSYFGRTAYLAQSPQFYMQLAMAAGFDLAFEIGPAFRAESGLTNRHAAEFTSIDVEVAWIDSHEDVMNLAEDLLRQTTAAIRDAHGSEIERCFGVAVEVPETAIPRLPFGSAEDLISFQDAAHLSHRAEQALSKHALEQSGHSWIFVTDYPARDRPFYTMREGANSRSFDLLWRGMEIASGCQREHRYEVLRSHVLAAGLEAAGLNDYLHEHFLEMFRHGCPPHGGFGIGLNRLLMALLGRSSLDEATFVFRSPDRLYP